MTLVINDVETIERDKYQFDEEIENLVIGSNVHKIEWRAFAGCKNLKNIILPDNIILEYAVFKRCSSLERIDIPDGTEFRGSGAFEECENLKEVTFSDSVKFASDDMSCFDKCTSLRKLPFSKSETVVRGFRMCENLETIDYPPLAEKVCDFKANKKIKRMEFPQSISSIRDFDNFYELEEVVFHEGIRVIDGFNGCPKLKRIVVPSSCEKLSGFTNCESLEEVVIKNPVTDVRTRFSGSPYGRKLLKKKTEDVLNRNIERQQQEEAKARKREKSANYLDENGVLYLNEYKWWNDKMKFSGNSSIKKIVARKWAIKVDGLNNLANLEELDLGPNVREISGFSNCPKLKNVKFNSGILRIEGFNDCEGLESVEFPEGLKNINGFNNLPNLKSAEIKEGIKSVAGFNNCPSLSKFKAAGSLESIGVITGSGIKSEGDVKIPECFRKEFVFYDAPFGIEKNLENFDFESFKEKYNPVKELPSGEIIEPVSVGKGFYFSFSHKVVHLPKEYKANEDTLCEPIKIASGLAKKFAESLGYDIEMEGRVGEFFLVKK